MRLPKSTAFRPALTQIRASTIAWVGVSAVASGWIGTVLVGGPIGFGAPTLEALTVGGLMFLIVALLAQQAAPESRRSLATLNLLTSLPLVGLVIFMYVSDQLVHLATRSSALGWVLVATLPLLACIAAVRAGGSWRSVDIAFGGTVGVAAAALIHVAVADTSVFDLIWALLGSIAGIAVVGGIALASPQPAPRTPLATTWRTAPFAAAWVMAIITAIPAAPRHELSTSAGAQVLAVTISVGVILTTLALWYGDRTATSQSKRGSLTSGMGRFAPGISTLALLIVGGLQAASYSEVTIDDLGQFWIAADLLTTEGIYPIQMHRAGLPGLPLMLIAAFAAFGRTYPAALSPMFLANALLPWLIYRAALEAGVGRSAAFAIAVLAVLVPVVQIYSLGAADPDAILVALLAAAMWAFIRVIRTQRPRQSMLLLGCLVGALSITRPEGPLYGGLLLLAAVVTTRSRWAVTGCCLAGSITAPVILLSLATLGRPWPTYNFDLSFANVVENAQVVGEVTAPKVARVLLINDVRFPVLLATILILTVVGAVKLTQHHWAFVVLPIAAAANVVTKLGISSYGVPLRSDFPPEFVRHVSYPLPVFALLVAVGVSGIALLAATHSRLARNFCLGVGIAAAVYLVSGSLYILGTPEEFHHGNQSGSLLADSIYVNAPELWMNPFDLPDHGWEFFEYRDRLFAWYAPFDNHSDSAGMAYQTLTGAVSAMGFAALLVGSPNRRPVNATRGAKQQR